MFLHLVFRSFLKIRIHNPTAIFRVFLTGQERSLTQASSGRITLLFRVVASSIHVIEDSPHKTPWPYHARSQKWSGMALVMLPSTPERAWFTKLASLRTWAFAHRPEQCRVSCHTGRYDRNVLSFLGNFGDLARVQQKFSTHRILKFNWLIITSQNNISADG